MRFKACILIILTVLGLTSLAEERVIYKSEFKDPKSLDKEGWKVKATPEQSEYKTQDGILRVTCHRNLYNGGFTKKAIPVIKKGTLEFDSNIAIDGTGGCLGVGLTIGIYNIDTWYHDYCKDWRRYFPTGPKQRMPGYNVEPVGHKRLTDVKKGKWAHYKIYFDHDKGIVEYYQNDMKDPVCIDYDVPVLGRDEYQGGFLRIGNMGITKGDVTYAIRNIVLKEIPESDDQSSGERNLTILFQGLSSDQYNMKKLLKTVDPKSEVRTYTIRTTGAAVAPVNQLKVDKLPSATTIQKAKTIVLEDMPAKPGQPDDCLPGPLLEQLIESVYKGANLWVMGGMFSLGKGGYQGTPLEKILPVKLGSPWDVKKFDKIETLNFNPKDESNNERSGILWYHNLKPIKDAEVLISAGDKPILVRRTFGKGNVYAMLGIPCGNFSVTSTLKPYWKSNQWRKWIAKQMKGK